MTITIVRHGMTAGNAAKHYVGRLDEPLCDEGIAALAAIPPQPEITRCYVTPLMRTRQTARILFPNARQIIVPGFVEMDFGAFEGKSFELLSETKEYSDWLTSNCETPCPFGESKAQFTGRICTTFERLIRGTLEQEERELTIVAHGGTIMAICSRFSDPARDYFACHTKNGQRWRIELDRDEWENRRVFSSYAPWEEYSATR